MTDASSPDRRRLDALLVARGFFDSRARARDAVLRGTVTVAGRTAERPGQSVAGDAEIAVADPARHYVSRAALKLVHALDAFGLAVAGRQALDIGASTGGFTQVLLERGAACVTALDVGHGQLHPTLAGDPRVRPLKGVNARALSPADLDGTAPDLVVCDVSFISLRLALPPALALAAPRADGVFLVKPQFEVGRAALGKGGVVRDAALARGAAEAVAGWLDGRSGWRVAGLVDSPVAGGDGNREFLLVAARAA